MDNYRREIKRILNDHWPEAQVLLSIGNPALREVITSTLLLEGGYTPSRHPRHPLSSKWAQHSGRPS